MWQYFWPHAVYDIIITLKEVKVQCIDIGSIRPGFVHPKSGSLMNIMHVLIQIQIQIIYWIKHG
jgi:hypothetical protein